MPAQGKFLALTFLVSMMPSVSALQLDCGPGAEAEEKTQHTLTCEGLQADDTIYWTKYDRNLGKITVATCDATGSCQTNFSTRYDVKRPNNVTSTLKILDVKRDDTFVEGEWSCVSRSNETASCYVTVVFLPHVGGCTVGFSEQSGQVTGRCEMHKVYPSPTCNWYERLEGQETDIPSNQTTLSLTQYVDSSSSQIYFRGECMLHRPLPVTAGSYRYKVLIIPGLVEPLVDFTTTNRVAVPAPPVLRNCPQDYVTDADASSCTCATSDLGSPQGSIAWYDPNKNVVLRNTSLILALPFSRVTAEFSGQTYRCGVVHHTGSPSVDYVPKIAASPNKPKLSGYDQNKEYKVGETITLKCSAAGGRPVITQLILECAGRPDEADSHVGDSVISRLSFTLMESDNNGECQCYATNKFLTSERLTQLLHVTPTGGNKEDYLAIGVGAGVGAAVLIGLVIVLVVILRWRKARKEKAEECQVLKDNEERGSIQSNASASQNYDPCIFTANPNSDGDHIYEEVDGSDSKIAQIVSGKSEPQHSQPDQPLVGSSSRTDTSSHVSESDTEQMVKLAPKSNQDLPQHGNTIYTEAVTSSSVSEHSMSQSSSGSASPGQWNGQQPMEEVGELQNFRPGESQTTANGSRSNEEANWQRTSNGNAQDMQTTVTQQTSESLKTHGNNISPAQPADSTQAITPLSSKSRRIHDGPSRPAHGKPKVNDDASLEPHLQQQADQQNSGKAPMDLSEQPFVTLHNESVIVPAAQSGEETREQDGLEGGISQLHNPLASVTTSSPIKTNESPTEPHDSRSTGQITNPEPGHVSSSAGLPDEAKAAGKSITENTTAGNDSSQEEHQRDNTETNKASHTAKTGDHGKIVHNEERESRLYAGTRADANAGDKTSTGDAPAINMADPNLIKQEQPQTGDNKDTLTLSTEEPSKQRHNANIERKNKPSELETKNKSVIQIEKDNKPKEESLASSTNGTVKHPQAVSSEEKSAPGNTEPEQSNQGPSPSNKDGGSPEVQDDDSDCNTQL